MARIEIRAAFPLQSNLSTELLVPGKSSGQMSAVLRKSALGRYAKGDHVKIDVIDASGDSEWMWLLVERSDDDRQLVFGKLDQQPIVNVDMCLGQELAVSFDRVREHRRSAEN